MHVTGGSWMIHKVAFAGWRGIEPTCSAGGEHNLIGPMPLWERYVMERGDTLMQSASLELIREATGTIPSVKSCPDSKAKHSDEQVSCYMQPIVLARNAHFLVVPNMLQMVRTDGIMVVGTQCLLLDQVSIAPFPLHNLLHHSSPTQDFPYSGNGWFAESSYIASPGLPS